MGQDIWHVETFDRGNYNATRHVAVSTGEAVKLVTDALADGNTGGVVVYRPPLQTGHSLDEGRP